MARQTVHADCDGDGGPDPDATSIRTPAVSPNRRGRTQHEHVPAPSLLMPRHGQSDSTSETEAFAEQLDDIAISQLAAVPNDDPVQAARLRDVDAAMKQLADMCN